MELVWLSIVILIIVRSLVVIGRSGRLATAAVTTWAGLSLLVAAITACGCGGKDWAAITIRGLIVIICVRIVIPVLAVDAGLLALISLRAQRTGLSIDAGSI